MKETLDNPPEKSAREVGEHREKTIDKQLLISWWPAS